MVALYWRGFASFVEWHFGCARIPNRQLSLPAARCDGAYQGWISRDTGAELQRGIRRPAPRLAGDSRFLPGQRPCSSDADGACVQHRRLYGYLVLSVWRMGAACQWEDSGDQSLVGGAVLRTLGRELLAGEL